MKLVSQSFKSQAKIGMEQPHTFKRTKSLSTGFLELTTVARTEESPNYKPIQIQYS